jgi:hypothetical protein
MFHCNILCGRCRGDVAGVTRQHATQRRTRIIAVDLYEFSVDVSSKFHASIHSSSKITASGCYLLPKLLWILWQKQIKFQFRKYEYYAQVMGRLFRLSKVTIVGYFYYLILLKLLHVSVVRPSSGRNKTQTSNRMQTPNIKTCTIAQQIYHLISFIFNHLII